ncbi:MAG: hypothetical protein AB7P99_20515 [Vicinamibacterales bacterium]
MIATAVLTIGLGSAWAQIAVFDSATTSRNAAIAALKQRVVDIVAAQRDRLQAMARRLGDDVDTGRYAAPSAPAWAEDGQATLYAEPYRAALARGDAAGDGFTAVARERNAAGGVLTELPADASEVIRQQLASLDAADSSVLAATHQAGILRSNAAHEARAIDRLEADVARPRRELSATAAAETVGGAGLIGAVQGQARLQYLGAIVEQLLIDSKRARDAEAAALNMQLRRLQSGSEEGPAQNLLSGAGDDLRTWRQP